MPRISMNTTVFNPIDFEKRIKPVEAYINTYNNESKTLDTLSMAGDNIASLITNTEEDKELQSKYNNYDTGLTNAVKQLESGDISSAMNSIRSLSRQYYKDLDPIKTAAAARLQDIQNYQKEKAKGDYIGNDPSLRGISSYMNGNAPNNFYIHGNDLYKAAMQGMSSASARNKTISDWGLDEDLLNLYFIRGAATGFSDKDVNDIWDSISENVKQGKTKKDLKKDLTALEADVLDVAHSVYDRYIGNAFNDDKYSREQAYNYILSGAKDGIGFDYKEERLNNTLLTAKTPKKENKKDDSAKITSYAYANRVPDDKEIKEEQRILGYAYTDSDGNVKIADKKIQKEVAEKNKKIEKLYKQGVYNDKGEKIDIPFEDLDFSTFEGNKNLANTAVPTNAGYAKGVAYNYTIKDKKGNKYKIGNSNNMLDALTPTTEEKIVTKYKPMEIDGVDKVDTFKLGAAIELNKHVMNNNILAFDDLNSSERSTLKSKTVEYINNVGLQENNLNNSIIDGDGDNSYGLFDFKTGKRLNEKETENVRAIKQEDIISVGLAMPNNNSGFKMVVSYKDKDGKAKDIYVKPNNVAFQKYVHTMDRLLKKTSTFNDLSMERAKTSVVDNKADVLEIGKDILLDDLNNGTFDDNNISENGVEIVDTTDGVIKAIVPQKIKIGEDFDYIKTYYSVIPDPNDDTNYIIIDSKPVFGKDTAYNGQTYNSFAKHLGEGLINQLFKMK